MIEKLLCEDWNVEDSDLISRSIGAVTGCITSIAVLLLLARLHMLNNVQLRIISLNLLNIWLR